MPKLNYKNININYTIDGEGQSLVLLHGFLENSQMWNRFIESFSKFSKVICIDLLGHGETGNLGYVHTMEDQAEMVKFVLDFLNVDMYSFVGHSMGGYVALAFGELFPKSVQGICLLNSTAKSDSDEKKMSRDRAIEAVKKNPKTFIRIAIPYLFSEENRIKYINAIDIVTEDALKTPQQGIIAALEGMKKRKDRQFLYNSDEFIMMIVISKNDPALNYNSLINQVENTKTIRKILPDGHMSHIENEQETKTIIKNFFKICHSEHLEINKK